MHVTEDIREWDYGDYEGKTSKQIREERKEQGMGEWDIWRDGCPGGEYVIPLLSKALPFHARILECLVWERVLRTAKGEDVTERKNSVKR